MPSLSSLTATKYKKEKDLQVSFSHSLKRGDLVSTLSAFLEEKEREKSLGGNGRAKAYDGEALGRSHVFELKLVREGKNFLFSQIEEHQWVALKRAGGYEGLAYKISDMSMGAKPFDCFLIRHAFAWVVVGYAQSGDVYAIPVDALWKEYEKSGRRGGVTLERIKQLGCRLRL